MVIEVSLVFWQVHGAGAGRHEISQKAEPRSVAGLGVVLFLIVFTRGAMFEIEHRVRMRCVPIEANRVG